jgi:ABC-type cobalamin/Fe3+-siderophores transport system ATPase subunit
VPARGGSSGRQAEPRWSNKRRRRVSREGTLADVTEEIPAVAAYHSREVDALLVALEEATRATPAGGPVEFVPPAGGELQQVQARFHHFIFGRRGSGKTSLLRYLERNLVADDSVTVWIDQELFMALSFPDVLVSSVLELMQGARASAATKAARHTRPGFWRRLFGRSTGPGVGMQSTLESLDRAIANLQTLKHLPNDRQIEWTRTVGTDSTLDALGSVRVVPIESKVQATSKSSESITATETVVSSKEEYLERSLGEFRVLIKAAADACDGGFVFLDEFYRVERRDQPLVLGYMHRLVKDTGLWLKVGSVRYWTTPYKGGSPPRGMQPTQDANVISLDRGLQLFGSTRTFLETILGNIARRVGVDVPSVLTDGAFGRLVLASGGVPRDYLRLTGEAIKHARNRGMSAKSGSGKVMAEDVNSAAGQTAEAKLDDLREDAPTDAAVLVALLEDLAEFCRHHKAAYFLVDGRDADLAAKIEQLQDLRFVHLLFDGETVPDFGSRRHRVLLLDVAYLSVRRALQVDFEGWTDRSKRRRRQLVYSVGAGAEIAADARESAARARAFRPGGLVAGSMTTASHNADEEGSAIPPTLPLFPEDVGRPEDPE